MVMAGIKMFIASPASGGIKTVIFTQIGKNAVFREDIGKVVFEVLSIPEVKYLTKKENTPQLAKLGYIYNTLWYGGRMSWVTKN